jgi:hypothetical protein
MKTVFTIPILFVAFILAPAKALATGAAGLTLQINMFDHGGTGALSAVQNGNTVSVTGSVTGAKNPLELYLDPGVTIRWAADYQAEIDDASRNVLLFEGGRVEMVSGSIGRTSQNGCAIVIHNCRLTISGGTVSAAGSGIPVYAALNSSIIMSGGSVENGIFISDGVAAITGGSVSSAEDYVFGIVNGTGAIGYLSGHAPEEGNHISSGTAGLIASVTATVPLPTTFIGTDEGITLTGASPGAAAKWVNNGDRADIEVSFPGTALIIPMGLEISGMSGMLNHQDIYVAVPVAGRMPRTEVTGTGYTGSIVWSANGETHPGDQPFGGEIYTAAAALTAVDGWQWADNADIMVNGQAVSSSISGNTLTFEAVFPEMKRVAVGSQSGILPSGAAGTVAFPVTATNMPDGTCNITLNGAPAGISAAAGSMALSDNAGTLAIDITPAVVEGTYPLTVTVDGSVTSNRFHLVVGAVSRTVSVGPQTGRLTTDMDDFATFAVTAVNVADGYHPVVFGGVPADVIMPESVFIHENGGSFAIGTTTETVAGVYPLTVTIDGVASGSFNLVVELPAPFIEAGATGLDELKVGQEVNGAVLFILVNGEYATAITPGHFSVSGLPQGLSAGVAVRSDDDIVAVPVTGTPTKVSGTANIILPLSIPSGNVQGATLPVGISRMLQTAVAKGDGAVVNLPVPNSITHSSITINAIDFPANGQTVEYAIDEAVTEPAGWQTGTSFTGLNANTVYYIFARSSENDDYTAGYPSYAEVVTLYAPVVNTGGEATVTYGGVAVNLPEIDGLFSVDAGAGARTYTVEAGGTGAGSITGNSLAVTKAGTFVIGLVTAVNGGYAAGAQVTATLTVNKGAGAKSTPPTLSGLTHNSITVEAASPPANGQTTEYAVSRSSTAPVSGWQTALFFTSLSPATAYYVFVRSAENGLYLAGEAEYTEAVTYLTSTHGVTLSESGVYAFPDAEYGYLAQTPLTVTVTNMGNQPTGLLTVEVTGADAGSFTISENAAAAGIKVQGGTATFKVAPGVGLEVGTYAAVVTLSDAGGISAGFNLNFTVNRLPVSNSGGEAAVTYGGAAVNLSAIGGLFTVHMVAGARTYTVETGGTGEGSISGNSLAVAKAGTFVIGLVTAVNGNYAASEKVTATLTVNRGRGATVEAPAPSSKTHSSIVIHTVAVPVSGQEAEYAVSEEYAAPVAGWQTGTAFTDLNANTLYYIFARSMENSLYHSGTASCTAIPIKTDRLSVVNTGGGATVIYAGAPVDLPEIDGLFSVDAGAGVRTYTVEASTGTGSISGNSLAVAKAGTFVIGLATAINGSYAACPKVTATLTVNRGAGTEVEAPALLEKTGSSITVNVITVSNGQEVEYAISSTDAAPAAGWQTAPTFTGLLPDIPLYIFARTVENDLYHTGTPSSSLQVTIDRVTGIGEIPEVNPLMARIQNGLLHVSGLAEGKLWRVFSISGKLIYHSVADSGDAYISLPVRGVYIVQSENKTVKVVFSD